MTSKPEYQRIIDFVVSNIESGGFKAGDKIPSENELAQEFDVARMTANRAIKELVHRGVLHRVKGSGSFVSNQHYDQTLVQISSISDLVRSKGAHYAAKVMQLDTLYCDPSLAESFGLVEGSPVYFAEIVHFEDRLPIQLERRWVNASLAQGFLDQDFSTKTTTEFLMEVAPLSRVEYRIAAATPDREIKAALDLGEMEPVLRLRRKTWSFSGVVTEVDLYHPGSRFSFSGYNDFSIGDKSGFQQGR